jgi:hypothetical protein
MLHTPGLTVQFERRAVPFGAVLEDWNVEPVYLLSNLRRASGLARLLASQALTRCH